MSGKPRLKGRAARLARLFPAGSRVGRAARAPFVLLVVLLLGGGLIGLLVLNSALSEGSFELEDLKQRTKGLTDEEQAIQRDIDAYSAPRALERRARELGMVPGGDPVFLAPDGAVRGSASPAPAAPTPLLPAPEALTPPPATASPGAGPSATPAPTASASGTTAPPGTPASGTPASSTPAPPGTAATGPAGAPPATEAPATPTPTPGR
ncbi:septum formation initiator family protein [Streptomyces sp. SID8352]|uniref:septum formation initiator family protein n=1 Tax=Streptomyces sp. SID8352 TaxID=2690338 RepID=UPI00136EE01C|nr:septum formation initiator family protein [Streptomyces sp. SID8352]MYU21547.1 septum formation initiator family protein [Streptomyces sp. SID8352]